jgi:hypothetical protein
MGNLQGVVYQGGQAPIVHIETDLHAVVNWANAQERRWAFSTSNAGARYTAFYNDIHQLNLINWNAVENRVFTAPEVKEAKQAEFLLEESFPWELVERIGVISQGRLIQVNAALAAAQHRPRVEVRHDWYFL